MSKSVEQIGEQSCLDIARSRSVVRRAVRISLVVGIVLATINHGDMIVSGQLNFEILCKVLATFIVPYSVSTYTSVLAVRESRSK